MNRDRIIKKALLNLKYAGYPSEFEKGFMEGLVYLVDQSEEYDGQDSKDFTSELKNKIKKDLTKFYREVMKSVEEIENEMAENEPIEDEMPKFTEDFGGDLASAVGIGRSHKLDSYDADSVDDVILDAINDTLEKFPTYTITLTEDGKIDWD